MSEIDPRPIVAETLRTAALWMVNDEERDMLRRFADAVEHMPQDDACCQLCEEVDCDEGCPMEHWRTQGRNT